MNVSSVIHEFMKPSLEKILTLPTYGTGVNRTGSHQPASHLVGLRDPRRRQPSSSRPRYYYPDANEHRRAHSKFGGRGLSAAEAATTVVGCPLSHLDATPDAVAPLSKAASVRQLQTAWRRSTSMTGARPSVVIVIISENNGEFRFRAKVPQPAQLSGSSQVITDCWNATSWLCVMCTYLKFQEILRGDRQGVNTLVVRCTYT